MNAVKRKNSTIINDSGKSKNPKIEALMNEMINGGGTETDSSTTQLPEQVLPHRVFPSTSESGEEHEDITETESEDSIDTQDGGNELPYPLLPVMIEEVFSSMLESMPRIKEEIVGLCSANESDEDEDVGEEPVQRNPKLELLPSTS